MLRPLRPVSTFICFLLSIFLCSFTALAQRTPDLEKIRKREVAVIKFIGDSTIPPLELESIIATRTSSWFERSLNWVSSSWGTPRQFIDESILADDTLRMFVYYRNKGYFDVRISDTAYESKESAEEWQKVYSRNSHLGENEYPLIEDTVVFRISEGKPYKVAGFTFEGFEHLPMDLQNDLTEKIGIKLNSQYSRDAIEQEALRAREILSESGYPFLSLPYGYTVVEKDTLRKTVTVSLKFKTGPRVRVGGLHIIFDTTFSKSGYVEDQVIHRQVSLDSGAWYKNSNKLLSEQSLYSLGTFQSASIALDTTRFIGLPDSLRDGVILPVFVVLRMRQSWDFAIYPYGGVSAFSQLIFGAGFSINHRNLFDLADNVNLQASYQIFPSRSVEQRWSIGGQLALPYADLWLFRIPVIFSGNFSYAFVFGQYFERISNGSIGSNFELSKDPAFRISLAPKLSLQYVRRDYINPALKPTDTSYIAPQQLNTLVSADLIFNGTNDPLFPSSGFYGSILPQVAIPIFSYTSAPSAAYIKTTLQIKTYFDLASIQERSVMAFRILGGYVALSYPNDPNKDITFENRYYGGGTNSLRGWRARTLLVSNDTSSGLPSVGGYKAFEANVEWRYALFHYPAEITAIQQFLAALRIAFFCDAGNVWDKSVPVAMKNFAVTIGTGLHYNTLFGTIRGDFGFKLYDPYPDGTLNKDLNHLLAIPSNSTGVLLWNRHGSKFWDYCTFEFGLGQAF